MILPKNINSKTLILSILVLIVLTLFIFRGTITSHIVNERRIVQSKARAIYLNHFLPSFPDLMSFIEHPQGNNPADFIKYYETVISSFPQTTDAYGMLGFLSFQNGETAKAISYYEKAILMNPKFFWFYYDLGLIYLKQDQMDRAGNYLKKASSLSPQSTTDAVMKSKVYQQLASATNFVYPVGENLKAGYQDAFRKLCLISYKINDLQNMLTFSYAAMHSGLDDNGEFYFYGGVAAYELKDHQQARTLLQECLKKDVKNAQAYGYLEKIFHDMGEVALAEKAAKTAQLLGEKKDLLAIDPDELILRVF